MSVITDWADDYTSADTNTPTSATAIPDPVDGATDLGAVLRDVKKVIRGESLNKGWSSDPINATYISGTTCNIAGNYTATIPTSTAVKFNLNGTAVYSHVVNLSYSAPNTLLTIGTSVLNSNLNTVAWSSILPGSTPPRKAIGYPSNTSSGLPWRVTQIGQFDVPGSDGSVDIQFAVAEYDNLYTILFQPISYSGGTPSIDHFTVIENAKLTSGFSVYFNDNPGASITVRWEYCVVRIT